MGNAESGEVSELEKERLARCDAATPASHLRQYYALETARSLSVLRQVAPGLPRECLFAIAEQAMMGPPPTAPPPDAEQAMGPPPTAPSPDAELEARESAASAIVGTDTPRADDGPTGCCHCSLIEPAEGPLDMDWRADWTVPRDQDFRVVCARCGCVRAVTVRPFVRFDGVRWPLTAARVFTATPTFKANRHVQIENNSRRVVRHRLSGLHSFRTIRCSEWITRGAATYELCFPELTPPTAVGIGVITPETEVNSDIAWCPGTRGWARAWGLCVENADETVQHNEIRALEDDACCHNVGAGDTISAEAAAASTNPDEAVSRIATGLRAGDTFRVRIDGQKRSLTISKLDRASDADPWREKVHLAMRGLANPAPPLALAVALKFAGDTCELVRCV